MDKQPKVSIIIINYNSAGDTIACLKSLNDIKYRNYRVLLVDNSSSDEFNGLFEQVSPHCTYIANKSNVGFAGGVNIGIKTAMQLGSDYVLLLNNDTVVAPEFLNELIVPICQNSDVAAVNPKIYYYDRPDVIWYAGGRYDCLHPHRFIKHTGLGEVDNGQHDNTMETQRLTGCCMLISCSAIEKVGMFDKDYFCYMEDFDWCVRARSMGYSLYYEPSSRIWHKVTFSSGGEGSPLSCYYIARNRALFLEKNFGLNKYKVVCLSIGNILKALVGVILRNNREQRRYILKGYYDYLRGKKGGMQ